MNDETKFELDQSDQEKSLVPAVRTKGSLVPLDPFSAYMQEVRKYPTLSEEEEKELAILYKESGDLGAAYKLTTANLMLVIKIAMTFKREWQTLMDLVQEGNIGLMKAVKNFAPFRGVRLSAYATWWIK
ncbi:MAG: RNA polymerase subunit sigma, partial [Nitrospina sp.]|nr:RNA polymerase subunit sigma [Nitrospina sp.]